MARKLVWILDDEKDSREIYIKALGRHFEVVVLENVLELKSKMEASSGIRSLLVCDPVNTKGSIREVFKTGTKGKLAFPDFIIVSKGDDLPTLRFFMDAGAADFLLKPVRPTELLLRVENALKREVAKEVVIVRNDLDGIQIPNLTSREYELLTVLMNKQNRSASRDEIQRAVWKKIFVNRKTLDVHLFNLRRKIRPYGYDILCQKQVFRLEKMPNQSTL